MSDEDYVLYEDEKRDMRITKSQADLLIEVLNFISDPRYFTPPYPLDVKWKYVKANKEHMDDFGNEIQSGKLYLSYGRFTPMRISLASACGLWELLHFTDWMETFKEKSAIRETAIKEILQEAAEKISYSPTTAQIT